MREPSFGPTGLDVYERTYSRRKPDGTKETWEDTVNRVVDGNLAFVDKKFHEKNERQKLFDLIYNFKILPGGRHLWMTGIPGRSFLFNCWRAGWEKNIADHFAFTFDQLMQGGGVGANYSASYLRQYTKVKHPVDVHIVCDPEHPDYHEMAEAGYLSSEYDHAWDGAERVEDSREGWTQALVSLFDAFWNGKEVLVFDLGLIRSRGSIIKTFGGTAAGPAPLAKLLVLTSQLLSDRVGQKISSLDAMLIDHWIGECVVSGNVRRSARMSIKNWADEDIFDFITCKTDSSMHWTTNISVEIDDSFFRALKRKDKHAKEVYKAVVTGMLTNGEPGFYNRSLSQVGELGDVGATNPCGEINLEPWEYCCLGHVNLDAFYNDFEGAAEAHRLMTRFLMRATFGDIPDAKSREVGSRNRRIGVGHFGFQGWLVKQGIRYSDSHRNSYVRKTLRDFYQIVRKEARRYAFQLRIPEPIKVTTVAPTGSIAKMPGRTEGIHPILFKYFVNNIRFSTVDDDQLAKLKEYEAQGLHIEDCIYSANTKVVSFVAKNSLLQEVEEIGLDPDYFVEEASEIEFGDMLAVQAMYQAEYADNAVSFTINVPEDSISIKEGMNTIIHYLPQLKGTTIMVDGTRPQAPYVKLTKEDYEKMTSGAENVLDAIDELCLNGACPIK